jgi:hypothetical protein
MKRKFGRGFSRVVVVMLSEVKAYRRTYRTARRPRLGHGHSETRNTRRRQHPISSARKPTCAEALFWDLIDDLREHDDRIEEGTIMDGRCAPVAGEFIGPVDFKNSGTVVKLPRTGVDELIVQGIGDNTDNDGCLWDGEGSSCNGRGGNCGSGRFH